MPSGLHRLSEADPAAVKQYLLQRQMPPEIIDWKYFDTSFNRDRERGIVWVRENQVAGFLGLIPFSIQKSEFRAECAWSCDWSVDPRQGAGMGLLLVKKARELYDGVFNLGGNENTRHIFPRLADRTLLDGGIGLVLPLRLGSVFALLPQRLRRLLNGQKTLRKLPVRWVHAPDLGIATIDPGLAPRVISVINATPPLEWRPIYDAQFFEWQFCRCPAITCWSCSIVRQPPLRMGALIWRSRFSNDFWRIVFCGDTSDFEQVRVVLSASISFVYGQGGAALFTLVSRGEKRLLDFFRRHGFLRHRNLPFYMMRGRCNGLPADDFSKLNFLDADLAYRFEQESAPDKGV